MIFPFLTSMYVAHILRPASVGEVAYAQNIVQYFSILAFLGIPTYGLREIARSRNEKAELSKVYSELVVINFISTIFFSACYYLLIIFNSSFHSNIQLHAIVGLLVISNMFNISWLYEGLEEFGYIVMRNAVFKVLMFLLIVIFVKDESDILSYASISVIGSTGNGIINIIRSRKYVSFSLKELSLKRHLRSIFLLVMVNLAIEIYTLVDTTMLGMMTTKDHVAFYTYASRVNKILLQITNVVTMVLVPRISLYYKEKEYQEFNRLLTKTLSMIIIGAVPMIIGLQFTSDFLFPALFGTAYSVSSGVEKILCYVLLISPVGYLLGSRVMLVSDNESRMVFCVGAGAIVNIIGNYLLIPIYAEYGAAITSVISEIVVAVCYICNGRKVYKLFDYKPTVLKVGVGAVLEWLILFLSNFVLTDSWLKLCVQIVAAIIVYGATLLILRESIMIDYLHIVYEKIAKSVRKQ